MNVKRKVQEYCFVDKYQRKLTPGKTAVESTRRYQYGVSTRIPDTIDVTKVIHRVIL